MAKKILIMTIASSNMTSTLSKVRIMTDKQKAIVWQTILFNCDCHTFDEVINQIIKAIGCDYSTASKYTQTADSLGSVSIYRGSREKCEGVARVLEEIRLLVKVST